MRKNKRILSIIILAVLVLLMFLAGYTFARYYKEVNAGRATARVARWSFGAGNTATNISFGDDVIAPGDSDQIVIEIDSTNSEVPLEYEVKFTNLRNIPQNMKFSAVITDTESNIVKTTEEVDSLGDLQQLISGEITDPATNPKRNVVINWRWPFNADDTSLTDTNAGTLLLDDNGEVVYDQNNLTSLDIGFDVEIIGRQIQN